MDDLERKASFVKSWCNDTRVLLALIEIAVASNEPELILKAYSIAFATHQLHIEIHDSFESEATDENSN